MKLEGRKQNDESRAKDEWRNLTRVGNRSEIKRTLRGGVGIPLAEASPTVDVHESAEVVIQSGLRSRRMVPQIRQLLEVVATGVSDRETIDELIRVIDDRRRWKEAHDLFSRIRDKTLKADRNGDGKLIAQYCFEEICAKSIYNESGPDDPFDSDSPFWAVPLALHAARESGIDRERVLAIVAG